MSYKSDLCYGGDKSLPIVTIETCAEVVLSASSISMLGSFTNESMCCLSHKAMIVKMNT